MVLEIIAKDKIFSVGGNLKGSYKIPTLVIQNPNSGNTKSQQFGEIKNTNKKLMNIHKKCKFPRHNIKTDNEPLLARQKEWT